MLAFVHVLCEMSLSVSPGDVSVKTKVSRMTVYALVLRGTGFLLQEELLLPHSYSHSHSLSRSLSLSSLYLVDSI